METKVYRIARTIIRLPVSIGMLVALGIVGLATALAASLRGDYDQGVPTDLWPTD